jgi:hypothetical protein
MDAALDLTAVSVTPAVTKSYVRIAKALLYWVPTSLVALGAFLGGVSSVLRVDSAVASIHHLGYPEYFAVLLGVAKLLGAVALLAPVSRTLREWAYAGFSFDAIAAMVSIAAVGDPIGQTVGPAVFLGLVQLSYWVWRSRTSSVETRARTRRV